MLRLSATTLLGALLLLPGLSRAQGLPEMAPVLGVVGEAVDLDARGDRWAAVFTDGSVRVHNPGGADWFLRPPRERADDQDDAVLRVEGMLGELDGLEGDDFDQPDFDPDAEEEIEVEEVEDPGDTLEELLQGEGSLTGAQVRSTERPILRWGVGERLAVSRGDGVWTSEDGGRRWRRLFRRPAAALADTGTSWALLLPSGEIWMDGSREELGLGALRVDVADVAASDGTLWAATEVGLWRRGETGWELPDGSLDPIQALVADPGWEGGLWVLGASGVRRTDDGGLTWRLLEPGGPVVGRIRWGGPAPGGSLIVSTNSGFWQYREGAWNRDPRQAVVAVGTEAGLFAVVDGAILAPPGAVLDATSGPPEWIELRHLLRTALSRNELTQSVGAGRVVQTLMPEVTLEGQYSPSSGIDYLPFTTADTDAEWRVLARLRWTPAGRSAAGETFEEALEEVTLRTEFDDIGIVGDRAILGAMGGRIGRNASAYRSKLIEEITELYTARNALYFERQSVPPSGLLDEVSWQLRLAEVDARLDALTDGAVSSWSPDGTE